MQVAKVCGHQLRLYPRRGLCDSCYRKLRRREDPIGHKIREHKYYAKNRERIRTNEKVWRKANPANIARIQRNNYMKKTTGIANGKVVGKYGITTTQYEELFHKQNGVCAICKRPERNKRLAIDHCYDSKVVRGLLCSACNIMIGLAQESILTLQSAKNYLIEVNPAQLEAV